MGGEPVSPKAPDAFYSDQRRRKKEQNEETGWAYREARIFFSSLSSF